MCGFIGVETLIAETIQTLSSNPRLLVVDDDDDILDSLSQLINIELPDYNVITADCVEKALENARTFLPTIALLDIKLGDQDGLGLISELKAINSEMSFVMMTAFRDNEYVLDALRKGAIDFLYKPIDITNLISLLQRTINHQNLEREYDLKEKQFKVVFEQATQWLFLLDKSGKVVSANDVALSRIKQGISEITGKYLWNTPWWRESHRARYSIQKGFATAINGESYFDVLNICIDGKINQVLEVSIKALEITKNKYQQVIMECRDITDKIDVEKDLHELNSNLEKIVAARSQELNELIALLEEEIEQRKVIEESLRIADKQANIANEAKSRFISKVSHEFCTPMNVIHGFAQLLELEEGISNQQREYIKEIIDSSYKMMDLITETIDFTSTENVKSMPLMESIEIRKILSYCFAKVEHFKERHNYNVDLINKVNEKTNLCIMADKYYIKQSLTSILSSIVKNSPQKGVIKVSAVVHNSTKVRVGIEYAQVNSMNGFPAEIRRSDKHDLSGVGLTFIIAKYLIEVMGGSIELQESRNVGNMLWIELKLAKLDG